MTATTPTFSGRTSVACAFVLITLLAWVCGCESGSAQRSDAASTDPAIEEVAATDSDTVSTPEMVAVHEDEEERPSLDELAERASGREPADEMETEPGVETDERRAAVEIDREPDAGDAAAEAVDRADARNDMQDSPAIEEVVASDDEPMDTIVVAETDAAVVEVEEVDASPIRDDLTASAAMRPTPSVTIASRTISIDGDFADWSDIDPVSGSEVEGGERDSFIDLNRVWLAADRDWLYIRFETGAETNLQALPGASIALFFDSDDRVSTGVEVVGLSDAAPLAGADLILRFSPRTDSGVFRGWNAAMIHEDDSLTAFNPYDLHAIAAPTHASREFEMRIRRGASTTAIDRLLLNRDAMGLKIVAMDDGGSPYDETPAIRAAFPAATRFTATDGKEIDLSRSGRTDLRLMSWNVEKGALFESPDAFARVFQAIRPDVICFQELGDAVDLEEQLAEWLGVHLPGEWELQIDAEGAVGIATRRTALPMRVSRRVSTVTGRTLRAVPLLVAADGRRLLITSVHFTCCGAAGDERDAARIGEAKAVHQMLRRLRYLHNPSGVVIMGDFNLVGSREPLDTLVTLNDLNASDLLDVAPKVTGDETNVTWRNPEESFPPGRLDFALVSDATLQVTRAFVLDTSKLSDEVLEQYGLESTDTTIASDHLPLVVDIR
ncbi:MAG: endonuclease/exonuclease/phosphatase family protein [Phycisphaerales bacterium]